MPKAQQQEERGQSLLKNKLIVVEYPSPHIYRPRLKDARTPGEPRLEDITTRQVCCPHDERRLAIFSEGALRTQLEQAVADANVALEKARDDRARVETSPMVKKLAKLEKEATRLRDAGEPLGLEGTLDLDGMRAHLKATRDRRDGVVRSAEAALAFANSELALLAKGIGTRSLKVLAPPQQGGEEQVRAVEVATIDLVEEWSKVLLDVEPAAFPAAWLPLVVKRELPSVRDWALARYEPLPAGTTARRGTRAADMYRDFLAAHGLHATQLSIEPFGRMLNEVFESVHTSDGNRYPVRVKRTAAEIEAEELALFKAEKAARERAEFEEWRRARAPAAE
jgi:hypothetical protein